MTIVGEASAPETKATEAPFLLDPNSVSEIVSNRTYMDGRSPEALRVTNVPEGVTRWLIPVDMSAFTLQVVTSVAPGARIARHAHDGAMLRYLTKGSFRLNGVDYKTGDWVLVPHGLPYEMETDEGYTVVSSYVNCQCGR